MFKQIISQLSFSPSTVEAIGQYAKKLRRQQRHAGWAALIFLLLSILQLLIVIYPSTPASLATGNDLIPGGVPSRETLLSAAETNANDFMSTAGLWGITKQDLAASQRCSQPQPTTPYTTGRASYRSAADEQRYILPNKSPVYVHSSSSLLSQDGWCGITSTGISFIVASRDGNISASRLPITPASPQTLLLSHTVSTSQSPPVRAGETVSWELTATNSKNTPVKETISLDIRDISEYIHITSVSQDGIISDEERQITWPDVTVAPNGHQSFTVTGYLNAPIDETAKQSYNPFSRDCQLTIAFGNVTSTPVACPVLKRVELASSRLPQIPDWIVLIVFGVFTLASSFLYLALRLRAKEIRIIRSQLNTGGL